MAIGDNKKIAVVISYCTMVVQFAVVFFVTPFLLKQLGKTEFGLYQLISSTVSYLSLLGFGFSASYIRFYSRLMARKDDIAINRLNGMFLTVFCIMSLACLLLGLALASNIDFVFGNAIDEEQHMEAYYMILLLAFNMALTFPKSIFVCNTTAHEKFVLQKGLVLCVDILSPLLQVLFVYIFKNPVVVSLAILLATSFDFIVNCIYNVGFMKMKFIFGQFDWPLMKEIIGFTFFIFLNQVLDLLSSTNIDNYLIGRICGTGEVTVYSMGGKISQMFHSVASPISAIFVPMIYSIVEEGKDRKRLTNVFTRVGKLQFAILYLFLIGFSLWGKPFLKIWIGEGYDESYYIAIILMSSLIIALSQNIGIEIQRAVNKHRVRSVVYLVIDMANVIISIPLVRTFGPIGAAIGTAIAMVAGTVIFMNIYYKVAIGVDVKKYWINVVKIIVFTLPSITVGVFEIRFIESNSIIGYLIQIMSFALVYFVVIIFIVFDKDDRRKIGIHRIWRKNS
ncbi:oligosaccharide flippase family protein [Pilosibacter fragilis]|uniref:lipopolysaccharide biosynthesis protein n=1 Tax=Pilosibacter fragilis TaxID=3078042 RepID=UPI0032D2932F